MFIYPIYNHNWRNISTIYIYITRLASNEIFSPSNKIHREVGRAKDLLAPRYIPAITDGIMASVYLSLSPKRASYVIANVPFPFFFFFLQKRHLDGQHIRPNFVRAFPLVALLLIVFYRKAVSFF
jgi:hypothetical protein